MNRRGEKTGWLLGWSGGFIWALMLAVILLVQGKAAEGAAGVLLTAVAAVTIVLSAPWRHPDTRYWQLMLPLYLVFFAALFWAIWASDGFPGLSLNAWSVFLLLPLLAPFFTMGKRTWRERDGG